MTSISKLKAILTDTEPVNLGQADVEFRDMPEEIVYDPDDARPEPSFTLVCNGQVLVNGVDYTTSWYHPNSNGSMGKNTVTVSGIGYGGGGLITINGGNIVANGDASSFGIGSGNAATVRTPIVLNWTNTTDSVTCKYYSGDVTIDREHSFVFDEDRSTTVTPDNINDYDTVVAGEYNPITRRTVNFYQYALDGEGANLYDTQILYDGDCAVRPAEEPAMEDYEFQYWADLYDNEFDFSTPITQDTDLYGVWNFVGVVPKELYSVRVEADEGCIVTVIAADSENNGGNDPGNGYSSDVSDYNSDYNSDYVSDYVSSDGNMTDDGEEGSLLGNFAVLEEGTRIVVSVKAKPGYELVDDPSGEYTVGSDMAIIARSVAKEYNLTAEAVPSEAAEAPTRSEENPVSYGTTVTVAAGEAATGYEFIGWYQPNGKLLTTETIYDVVMYRDTNMQARYRKLSGTVTFRSGSSVVKTMEAEAGSFTDSDFPSAPAAGYGYEFSRWDMTADEINAALANGNVTVNAVFVPKKNSFTVTIYNGESETPETVNCTQSTLISRTAQAVDGKNFAYWMLDDSIFSYNSRVSYTAISTGVLRACLESLHARPTCIFSAIFCQNPR